MKKLFIPLLFVGYAIFTQSCKKTSTSDSSSTTAVLQATINGNVWTPDTISATVTYTAATNIKTLVISGTKRQKRVVLTMNTTGGATSTGFPVANYYYDGTNVIMNYYTQQKDASGNYVFVQKGTVQSGSGSATVSVVDTVAKTLTGTFRFTPTEKTLDANGNVTAINVTTVAAGTFTKLPYTYTKQ